MSKRVSLSEGSFFGILIFATLLLNGCGGGGSSPRSDVSGVDTTAPTVESTSPVNGAPDVLVNTTISATFSEAINEATLPNNFIVSAVSGGGTVSGSLSFSPGLRTATFLLPPSTTLTPNTIYNVTITTGVTDLANPPNPLAAPVSWAFTTGSSIDNTPPSFGVNGPQLNAGSTSSSSIFLSWNAATDNTTPANQIRYVICQSTADGGCSSIPFPTTGVVFYETIGTTNFSISGLQSGTYFFVVRARDSVGLMDENTAQSSAKTPGKFVSLDGSQNANCTVSNPRLCGSDATSPSVAMIGSTLYLTWSEANNIYVRSLNTTSKIWSAATPVSVAENQARRPRIASSATSILYITYTECDSGGVNCKIFVKQLSGGNWVPVPISGTALNVDSSKSASDSAIAFDSGGVPYVVWVEPDISGAKQVLVKHFDLNTSTWIQDGGPLNVDSAKDGAKPAIAIDGAIVKVAWSECTSDPSNCDLHVKALSGSAWTLASPGSLKTNPFLPTSHPRDPSLTFVNGVLHLAWHESDNKAYVRKEEGGVFTAPVAVADVSAASNVSLGATATAVGSQVPYLVFADNAPRSTRIFVKRWDGTAWVTEGDLSKNNGALNMTGGSTTASTMDSSIAFLQGTPYVAWSERGACIFEPPSSAVQVCGQDNSSVYQIYVKRLE